MERDGRAEVGAGDPVRLQRRGRRTWVVLAWLLVGAAAVGAVVGDRGLREVWRRELELERTLAEAAALRQANRDLEAEIDWMSRDPRFAERVAREDLGMAKAGETVFIIADEGVGSNAPADRQADQSPFATDDDAGLDTGLAVE
ncbi:MAG: septum formation initiator family protein [Candidatus Schekmanbacteria bacterium]|nr:septum formation initiator family protein [Candidatus Schekmanbacteria bacterium]